MNHKKRIYSIIAIIIIIMFILGSISLPIFGAKAETLESLQQRYSQLQKQLDANKKQLDQNKADRKATADTLAQLDQNITLTQDQIDNLSEQISSLNRQITDKQAAIEQTQKSKDANTQRFMQRLRAKYMAGEASFINVMFASNGLLDFLTREQVVLSITQHDNQLIEQLKAQEKAITDDKNAIEQSKQALVAKKSDQAAKQRDLNSKKTEKEQLQASLNSEKSSLEAQKDKIQKDMEAADQQIEALRSVGNYVGGGLLWPLQGIKTTLTSYFAYRTSPTTGRSEFHTGIDITKLGGGTSGYPISAANDGTIILAQYSNVSYGNHIVIDHGGGMTTLYGHCSSFAKGITEGVKVKKGQVIAYVGSTGNSTGPHLHFSVLINGKYVNPLNYSYINENCSNSDYYRHISGYLNAKP